MKLCPECQAALLEQPHLDRCSLKAPLIRRLAVTKEQERAETALLECTQRAMDRWPMDRLGKSVDIRIWDWICNLDELWVNLEENICHKIGDRIIEWIVDTLRRGRG